MAALFKSHPPSAGKISCQRELTVTIFFSLQLSIQKCDAAAYFTLCFSFFGEASILHYVSSDLYNESFVTNCRAPEICLQKDAS